MINRDTNDALYGSENVYTYRVEYMDSENDILMFEDGYEYAYDAFSEAYATIYDEMNQCLDANSMFFFKSAIVWMYRNGKRLRYMGMITDKRYC